MNKKTSRYWWSFSRLVFHGLTPSRLEICSNPDRSRNHWFPEKSQIESRTGKLKPGWRHNLLLARLILGPLCEELHRAWLRINLASNKLWRPPGFNLPVRDSIWDFSGNQWFRLLSGFEQISTLDFIELDSICEGSRAGIPREQALLRKSTIASKIHFSKPRTLQCT